MRRLLEIALVAATAVTPAQLWGNRNNHALIINGLRPDDDLYPQGQHPPDYIGAFWNDILLATELVYADVRNYGQAMDFGELPDQANEPRVHVLFGDGFDYRDGVAERYLHEWLRVTSVTDKPGHNGMRGHFPYFRGGLGRFRASSFGRLSAGVVFCRA
jgi:hypothetical protein